MTIRRYRESDRAALKKLSAHQDFPYPDPDSPLCDSIWVACDDEDRPVMEISAHRTAELYLRLSPDVSPMAALHAGGELLRNIRDDLCFNGLNEAQAFVSPRIERSFGRHLQKHFGAIRDWAAFKLKF
jgi:hypothetical protein